VAALLLDENVPRSVGRALREAGHDVVFVANASPTVDDRSVLAVARAGRRVLVTFDADFGDLIYQQNVPAPLAIIYLRLHPIDPAVAARMALQALVDPVGGQFVV
jgi:predicted nuclease of predicted toxin-antitoxin system